MIGSIEKEHLFVIGTTKSEQSQIGFNYNFLGENKHNLLISPFVLWEK